MATMTAEDWMRYLRAIAEDLETGEVSQQEQRGCAKKMIQALGVIEIALEARP